MSPGLVQPSLDLVLTIDTAMWIVAALMGAALGAGGAAGGDVVEATLRIDDAAEPSPILSPGCLFGSFYEDFLHSGDGGA